MAKTKPLGKKENAHFDGYENIAGNEAFVYHKQMLHVQCSQDLNTSEASKCVSKLLFK